MRWPGLRRGRKQMINQLAESAEERLAQARDLARQVSERQDAVDAQHRESRRLAAQNSFGALMRDALTDRH